MDLIARFHELMAQVPEILQPVIVALAGAVPFIEGEGAASIGILGGVHPVLAVAAGATGNFVCVLLLVLLSSGARSAIVSRQHARSAAREPALVGSGVGAAVSADPAPVAPSANGARSAARRAKFQRALERYGVPGVSLLGPLLLPTQFTATMLAAAGVSRVRVLAWQAVAILGWTTLLGVVMGGVVHAVG